MDSNGSHIPTLYDGDKFYDTHGRLFSWASDWRLAIPICTKCGNGPLVEDEYLCVGCKG